MKYRQRTITALLDTGNDITVAGSSLARKFKWEIYHYPVTSVKTANGENMLIDGILYVSLEAETQGIESAILISPDMTGLISGIDWMEKQDCIFNCPKRNVKICGEWIQLKREPTSTKVRRIYVNEDVVLPPTQQTTVKARIARGKRIKLLRTRLLEKDQVEGIPHVYSVRCLIPARTSDIKVALLNAKRESQVILQGTDVGKVHDVKEVKELNGREEESTDGLTPQEAEALKKIMKGLPSDLTKEQRQKVWDLLVKYRTIIATGDQDIGRTDLVEYRIDTVDHRPIRQPLRRHLF